MSESSNPTPDAISTNNTASQLGAVLLMIVAMIQWLAIVGVMIWVVPKFKSVFIDFGTNLPTVTVRIINGRWGIAYGSTAMAVGLLLGLITRPRSSAAMGLAFALFIAGFIVLGLVLVALNVPLPGLID
jgi:hypothetical protein